MSKTKSNTTAPSAPSFTNGSVSINGQTKANTYLKNGSVVTEYTESPYEQALREQREKQLSQYLPKVNTMSSEYQAAMQRQLEAYQNKGTELINEVYDPMINTLKSDIAKRFGSLNNSSFFNSLNKIENKRSDAVESLATDLLAKQDELEQLQLQKNYDYINLLYGMQQDYDNKINNLMSLANSSSGKSISYPNTTSQLQNDGFFSNMSSSDVAAMISVAKDLGGMFPEATAGVMSAFSDKNLKKNITPLEDEQEILERLKAYKYEYDRAKKSDLPKGEQVGLIAQEVEKVLPEAVIETPDGKKVDYTKLVAVLVGAVNDLNEKVDALSNKK